MAALLGSLYNESPQDFQDKMKKMAENLTKYSSSSSDTQVSTPKPVHIKMPALGALTYNTSISSSTIPRQIIPIQLGKQRSGAGALCDR